MNKPNIFTFATKELSQDAFICWLAAWANPTCAESNPKLHRCAQQFIIWLLKRGGVFEVNSLESVKIKQQYYFIDILIVVNNKYRVLIEDKIHSGQHGDQLKRYINAIIEKDKVKREEIIPIYLKTGHPESGEFLQAKKDGYSVILRLDLLDVLGSGACGKNCHPLFKDFYHHLEQLEEEVNSWKNFPVSLWKENWAAWVGFYSQVYSYFSQKLKPNEHGWGYVPNQNGGFMGYWLDCGRSLHVHLQEETLCIRVWEPDKKKRSSTRDKLYSHLIKKTKEMGRGYSKPVRFGWGEYMTIATKDNGYIVLDEDGILNLNKTIASIEEAYEIIMKS